MQVQVIDLGHSQPRAFDRHAHGAGGVVAGRRDLYAVIGVAGRSVADHLGINLRAALAGMFQLFKHENPRALAQHKAVTVGIKRARGALGLLVPARRDCPHAAESGHQAEGDAGFDAAADDGVELAEADGVPCIAHRVA